MPQLFIKNGRRYESSSHLINRIWLTEKGVHDVGVYEYEDEFIGWISFSLLEQETIEFPCKTLAVAKRKIMEWLEENEAIADDAALEAIPRKVLFSEREGLKEGWVFNPETGDVAPCHIIVRLYDCTYYVLQNGEKVRRTDSSGVYIFTDKKRLINYLGSAIQQEKDDLNRLIRKSDQKVANLEGVRSSLME